MGNLLHSAELSFWPLGGNEGYVIRDQVPITSWTTTHCHLQTLLLCSNKQRSRDRQLLALAGQLWANQKLRFSLTFLVCRPLVSMFVVSRLQDGRPVRRCYPTFEGGRRGKVWATDSAYTRKAKRLPEASPHIFVRVLPARTILLDHWCN